jgi:hypothetical protein
MLAIQEKFGSCSGIIVNVMGVKLYKRKRQDGTGPGILTEFDRRIITRTPLQLQDSVIQINKWIKLIEHQAETNDFAKHKGGFSCYFPKACKHTDLCVTSVGTELDEQMVSDSYEKVNPFNYLDGDSGD